MKTPGLLLSPPSKALRLSDLPSGGSHPSADQYAETVCRSMPYRLAMSLKFGLIPDSLYMLNSPIRFLSKAAPFSRCVGESYCIASVARLAKIR